MIQHMHVRIVHKGNPNDSLTSCLLLRSDEAKKAWQVSFGDGYWIVLIMIQRLFFSIYVHTDFQALTWNRFWRQWTIQNLVRTSLPFRNPANFSLISQARGVPVVWVPAPSSLFEGAGTPCRLQCTCGLRDQLLIVYIKLFQMMMTGTWLTWKSKGQQPNGETLESHWASVGTYSMRSPATTITKPVTVLPVSFKAGLDRITTQPSLGLHPGGLYVELYKRSRITNSSRIQLEATEVSLID